MKRIAWLVLPLSIALAYSAQITRTHTVVKGDTLSAIARRHSTTTEAICAANGITTRSILRIGQELKLPGGATAEPAPTRPSSSTNQAPASTGQRIHTIASGDSLWSIAKRYGVSMDDLAQWNRIGRRSTLSIGQRLRVSDPRATSEPKPIASADPPQSSPAEKAPAPEPPRKPPRVAPPSEKNDSDEEPDSEPEEEPRARESDRRGSTSGARLLYVGRVRGLIDKPKVKRGRWFNIVLHHSGTPKGSAAVFERYHKQRGMQNGLAYHFVIGNGSYSGDGEIEVGARWLAQIKGGHVKSAAQNEIALGICFVGNFNQRRPSPKQLASCIELVEYLRRRCGGKRLRVWMHRDINVVKTECPGDLFPSSIMYRRLK